MKRTSSNRKRVFGLLGAVLALAPASVLLASGGLFQGGGYGPTPEVAIYSATDARACAASVGLYTCTMVGEPEIFVGTGPKGGVRYTAQVSLECTP
jgi:hypothetical protein